MADYPGSKKRARDVGDSNASIEDRTKKSKVGPSVSFADVLSEMGRRETSIGGAELWARSLLDINDEIRGLLVLFQYLYTSESIGSDGNSIIQLYGSTEDGHSILAHVTGFMHYLYFPAPSAFTTGHLKPLTKYLNGLLKQPVIRIIELEKKKTGASESKFLKVIDLFTTPEATYESTLDFAMCFMLDKKIVGMSWIELPADSYTIVSKSSKRSHCQLEVTISHKNLIAHAPDTQWSQIAPLRILSFDIEIKTRGMDRHGENEPFIRNVFTLDTCSPVKGSQILSYETEQQLLQSWSDFVKKFDPDVITGYNVARFDIPYLLNRATTLKLENFNVSRLPGIPTKVPKMPYSDWDNGLDITGRIYIDMLHVISTNYSLMGIGAYKLGAVAEHFLHQKKEDVHFSVIAGLQDGTPETRRQLAIYCAKDAYLPQMLMNKLGSLGKRVQVTRQNCVPFPGLTKPAHLVRLARTVSTAINEGRVLPDPLQRSMR